MHEDGWKNYPTWCVNLWLTNDEPLYRELEESVRLVCDRVTEGDEYGSLESRRRFELAEGLKRWVEDDLTPDLGATFPADLLGYALGLVDWYELAETYLADFAEAAV